MGILYALVVGYSLRWLHRQPLHDFLSHLNSSLATVLIPLFVVRVAWKFMRTNPAAPAIAPRQLLVARSIQNMLYFVIFLSLVSGYLMMPSSYVFFGLVGISTPFAKGPETEFLAEAHSVCIAALTLLVGVHIAGVLNHTMRGKVNILGRML